MRYRFLIYGTSRATGLLSKYVGWGKADTPARRSYHLTRAGETLCAPRLISVERVRVHHAALS